MTLTLVTVQYCNELSMTIELDSTLSQAEVLFLSFAQVVADIDRRQAEESVAIPGDLRRRNVVANDKSPQIARPQSKQTTFKTPVLSEEIRDLLKAGR